MKNMNKFAKALVLGLVVYLTLVPSVAAAPLVEDSDTVITQIISAGALTIKAPLDVELPAVTVSSEVEDTNITAEDFLVDDARGLKPLSQPGWTFNATMSKLTDGAGSEIPFEDVNSTRENKLVYKLSPLNLVAYNNANLEGVNTGLSESLVEAGTSGVSEPKMIMSATTGAGKGRYGCDVKIDLQIPANSDAAEYESTMIFTLQ
jgi:hypothetical protein